MNLRVDEQTIYTVTGIVYNCPKSHCRCFGWYKVLIDAEKAVDENRGDMNEAGYYQWVVIEEIPEGVWRSENNEIWYEWDGSSYKNVEKPNQFRSIVNWGIG